MPVNPGIQPAPADLALVKEGDVRIAPLLGIPRLLADFGVDADAVMAEAGCDQIWFEDGENTIPFADAGRLLSLCAARTQCPHFGLLVGQNAGLDVLGVVGRLAAHAPDVGSALRNTILYLHLHDRGAIPTMWVNGDRAVVAYTIYQPTIVGTAQIYDLAMAVTYNTLKTLVGPGWKASEICLFRARPDDIKPYRRFFGNRLSFGDQRSVVVFPASFLDRRLSGANAQIHAQIMCEIERLEARGGGDLATQLRRVLRRLLIAGAGQEETSISQVAAVFAIHRRTLNRRLRADGTSFKALIDETRYDIARQLLRDTRLAITDIATALDYSEAAAFDRAFRRWSGMSPTSWRTNHSPI